MSSRRQQKSDRHSDDNFVVEDEDDYVVVGANTHPHSADMEVASGRSFDSHHHHQLHNSGGSSSTAQSGAGASGYHGSQSSPLYSDLSQSSNSTQDIPRPLARIYSSQPSALTAVSSTASVNSNIPVPAKENVMNMRADKEASLFQICLLQRNRLRAVPGFEQQLQAVEQSAMAESSAMPLDPVTLLWRTYRKGLPLITIYNALQPAVPLMLEGDSQESAAKREKKATFKFLRACVRELKFPTNECFILGDLYGEDTTGFVKVVNVINRITDMLVQKGLIVPLSDSASESTAGGDGTVAKRTHRQNVVNELVCSERTYVQHIEILQEFKMLVMQKGVIPGDSIHSIFLNLDALLDFQRRFLIRVEQTNALPEEDQNWGELFQVYANGFRVYEPYITNQKNCEAVAMKEFDNLREAGGRAELRQLAESPASLTGFLVKPWQRISKYPMLLEELLKKGDLDDARKKDLEEGIAAVRGVLLDANARVALSQREKALEDLKLQIDDWRSHDVTAFGVLLLFGTFNVNKGDGHNTSREYKIYLFERILLCCKEMHSYRQKNKLKTSSQFMGKSGNAINGKPKMQLRGRIFMQNVSDIIVFSQPGQYQCQIFWRSDEQDEFFTVNFPTEDCMKEWCEKINDQRKICQEQARRALDYQNHTNSTEFIALREQSSQLENPYLNEKDNADDDEDNDSTEYPQSRNGSTSSLRSRSGTGDNMSQIQQARSLFPGGINTQPLSLRTQHLNGGAGSPSERGGNSYFSPVGESPVSGSARTSNSSGVFQFPRPGQSVPGHYEDQNRFTAPALGRTPNVYFLNQRNDRNMQGHVSAPQPHISNAPRLRSTSNPDITHRKQLANAPPVPSVPSHLAQHSALVNRSQSNSPTNANGMHSKQTSNSPLSQLQGHDENYAKLAASGQAQAAAPLPLGGSAFSPDDLPTPSQLKVKVKVPSEGCTMMLVVSYNISYQTLKDRIDAKLQRNTSLSLANGSVVLKYLYDDEFCSIRNDEDVQTAFESWREQQGDYMSAGQLGEIELFCHATR